MNEISTNAVTHPPRAAQRAAAREAAREAAIASATIGYPPELPVSQRRDDIAAAIRDHQVVIVAGETGSGKTTQLPKICLELGRGVAGQIGHTQPRRIAARTVAERIAEELKTDLGDVVGYKVRFTDKSGDNTAVKLMTDGILLAEIGSDRNLRRYDTLIIDEAHERSLNIDFILGYLRQLLPRRPDLKVIITSATIDPERFAEHFKDPRTGQPAPIIEVSGRTYPVEVRYRPVNDPEAREEDDRDQVQAISDAIGELEREGPGDILVFLSGEREIRDTADALKGRPKTDVLPLYGRLSAAEQHRVFEPSKSSQLRRVVLATNVAETSLTVPGIRYVIDPGTARISRYSLRTKVQRLPIEAISQASANQRKGRCGRVADGICIRLYSLEDFESRPEFTDPEIQRTNLASVILQMAAARLGDVRKFPFVDPPDPRAITDGVRLLEELNAMERDTLTETGRQMARLPVDPRIARMIIESGRQGCAREILVIAAALSIQDPRERPTDNQQAADTAHRRFTQPESDFVAFVALWDYLAEKQRELTGSAFRRLCRAEFLNYLRVREWQDLHAQLSSLARELGINSKSSSSERTLVHTSLLSGLLSHVGMKMVLTATRSGGTRRRERPDPGRTRPPAAAGVPRRPRHQVRRLPRLRPREKAAGLDRRGRAGRDLAAVGQDRRRDRTGMGRADRRAPGQAELQRAPLVALARRRRRDREGHPLRHPDHRRPPAAAGEDRPGPGPGAVHQARPGRGRLADQAPLLPRQHRPHRAGGRARAARPPPRPGGGRGRPVRVLRRPRPGRRHLRPPRRKALAPTSTYRLAFPAGERNFHERGHEPASGRAARRRPRSRARSRHRERDRWLPPGTAGQPAPGGHRGRRPRPPGGDRRRRDRLGQDDAAAQDLPGNGTRRRRADRPHPAAADRRPQRRRADRRGAQTDLGDGSVTRSGSPTNPATTPPSSS